jgi:hypothetical protein
MATSTYLSNPKVEVGASSASVTDITDQVSSCVVNFNVEALEDTAFGSQRLGQTPQGCSQTAQR